MTPPSLIKMLNITLQTLKPDDFSKEQPVIGAWVSPDGHYAFVEFRTAEEATKGFVLNGFKIMGVPLKIGRPKTYQGLPQTIEESGPSNTVASILMKSKKNVAFFFICGLCYCSPKQSVLQKTYTKKRGEFSCYLSHNPRLWHCPICRNEQCRNPHRMYMCVQTRTTST